MTIHKEGYKTIAISTIVFGVINLVSFYFLSAKAPLISLLIFVLTFGLLLFLISFFRIPNRQLTIQECRPMNISPTGVYRSPSS